MDTWISKSHYFNASTFNRYDRLQVPLKTRIECMDLLHGLSVNNVKKKTMAYQVDRMNSFTDDEWITIYRGFTVRKGQSIRKGVSKFSDDGHIHDEGSSYSYSFSKAIAIQIYAHLTTHIIKKHSGVDEKKATRILKDWHPDKESDLDNYYEGFYKCVGEFKVKKKDILFLTDLVGEDEVIINPSKVRLVDYRFLNIIDKISMQTFHRFVEHIVRVSDTSADRMSIENLMNCDGVYDYTYAAVSDLLKNDTKHRNNSKKIIKGYLLRRVPDMKKVYNSPITYAGKMFGEFDFGFASKEIGEKYVSGELLCKYGGNIFVFPKLTSGVRQRKKITKSSLKVKSQLMKTGSVNIDNETNELLAPFIDGTSKEKFNPDTYKF